MTGYCPGSGASCGSRVTSEGVDEQMTGCGTCQAHNGRESVGLLCTVSGDICFSSKSVCVLQ